MPFPPLAPPLRVHVESVPILVGIKGEGPSVRAVNRDFSDPPFKQRGRRISQNALRLKGRYGILPLMLKKFPNQSIKTERYRLWWVLHFSFCHDGKSSSSSSLRLCGAFKDRRSDLCSQSNVSDVRVSATFTDDDLKTDETKRVDTLHPPLPGSSSSPSRGTQWWATARSPGDSLDFLKRWTSGGFHVSFLVSWTRLSRSPTTPYSVGGGGGGGTLSKTENRNTPRNKRRE